MNEPCVMGTIQQAHVDASGMFVVCMPVVYLWYTCGILVICRLTGDQWQGTRQSCQIAICD